MIQDGRIEETLEHASCGHLIAALSDVELPPDEELLVQGHLRDCLRCQRELFVQWQVSHALVPTSAPRAPASSASIGSKVSGSSALPTATVSAGADAWKTLITGDQPADWVQRLRAAGFPDSAVRAIVSAQIRERYAARRADLLKDNDTQYWSKSWNNWDGGDAASRAALRELWKAERAEIKAALGDTYADSPEYQRMVQRQFGNLSKEKVDAVQKINEDYQELISEVHQKSNGILLPEDREKLAFIEKEKRADLAAIVTPAELQAYELRSSQTANGLRWQLGAFAPSEQEFCSIFTLQRDFDLQFTNRRTNTDEVAQKARYAAQTALESQIKSALGETRYAEYQRSQDGSYQQLTNLTERFALPKENAVAIYELSKDVQKRAQQIGSDKNLNADSRNQALVALADEATAKVSASLGGDRGLEAYKETGGWWLNNIAPPRPKSAAK